MKINITHQNNSISFEIEKMTPEHEAFEVLHAFTISAFEDLNEPLVFSFAGADGDFQLQDSKDWKEGLLKHFKGNEINLTIVGDDDSDSDSDSDSFCLVTSKGDIVSTDKVKKDASEPKKPVEKPKVVQNNDEGVIEDYKDDNKNSDDKKLEDVEDKKADDNNKVDDDAQKKSEENIEGSPPNQGSRPPNQCRQIKARVVQFITDVGCEALQNIIGVAHSLLKEGAELAVAIRTGLETSDVASNHPFVKDFLPVLDVYIAKFQNWVPQLAAFNIDHILALIPNLVECVSQHAEGRTDIELDIAPIFSQICPQLMQKICAAIPNGQERVWQVDAFNPFEAINTARQDVSKESGKNLTIHKGITCDGCNVCPIIGIRYKSVLRPDFDLCEDCEKKHDPNDPVIKMKRPIQNLELLPGLQEFSRQCGAHRRPFHPRCPRGFRGRGRGCRRGRGRGRGCWKKMWTEICKQQRENCNANAENGSARPGHPFRAMFDFADPADQQQNNVPQVIEVDSDNKRDPAKSFEEEKKKVQRARKLAKKENWQAMKKEKYAEIADKKRQVKALKREAKQARKDLHKMKKEQKKEKKQMKKSLKDEVVGHLVKKSLKGEVVGHLDNEENSVQFAGSIMLKTWKVKNTGDVAWPAETIAVFRKGNKSMVQDDELLIGAVEPNDVAYVRCVLNVPELKGAYHVCYNLTCPEVGNFGSPLISRVEVLKDYEIDSNDDDDDSDTMDSAVNSVASISSVQSLDTAVRDSLANSPDIDDIKKQEIKVVQDAKGNHIIDLTQYDNPLDIIGLDDIDDEVPPKPANAPSAPAANAPLEYSKELEQLKQMGFQTDDETLHSVLVACNGDLGQAIQLLM